MDHYASMATGMLKQLGISRCKQINLKLDKISQIKIEIDGVFAIQGEASKAITSPSLKISAIGYCR